MRTLVFIPPSPVRSAMEALTSYLGLFALNATLILPFFGMLVSFTGLGLVFLAAAVADYVGLFKLKFLLLILAIMLTYYRRDMLPASIMLSLMVLSSTFTHLYLGWLTSLLWTLLPLALIARKGIVIDKWSYLAAGLSALLFVGTSFSPYHMAQVFILAMGIVSPWLLPLGVLLYGIAPRNRLFTALLLTGPTLQISNQVLLLSYYTALEIAGGGVEKLTERRTTSSEKE